MNYQPLFDLMSEHRLTLLESEMDEIIHCVDSMKLSIKEERDRLILTLIDIKEFDNMEQVKKVVGSQLNMMDISDLISIGDNENVRD